MEEEENLRAALRTSVVAGGVLGLTWLTGRADACALCGRAVHGLADPAARTTAQPAFEQGGRAAGGGTQAGGLDVLAAEGELLYPINVPAMSSNPSATATLFIDFDGATIDAWQGRVPGDIRAYDVDGDPTTFTATELANIGEIFQRVAEKFSPFNINVTTVDPGVYLRQQTTRVIVGGAYQDWYGARAGGIASLNGFSSTNDANRTAFAWSESFTNKVKSVAEVITHEAGHTFGLQHQSLFDPETGEKLLEYNTGSAQAAPIMGNSYSAERGLWWRGRDTRNRLQDDLAVITRSVNGFGYRPDDHGGSIASATPMDAVPAPEQFGPIFVADGIIGQITDLDVFSFTVEPGPISIVADVAEYGAMLDLSLLLSDSAGNLLASIATASLGEKLDFYVSTAGTWFVTVTSAGNYGDIGQYSLAVYIPEPVGSAVAVVGMLIALSRRRR